MTKELWLTVTSVFHACKSLICVNINMINMIFLLSAIIDVTLWTSNKMIKYHLQIEMNILVSSIPRTRMSTTNIIKRKTEKGQVPWAQACISTTHLRHYFHPQLSKRPDSEPWYKISHLQVSNKKIKFTNCTNLLYTSL